MPIRAHNTDDTEDCESNYKPTSSEATQSIIMWCGMLGTQGLFASLYFETIEVQVVKVYDVYVYKVTLIQNKTTPHLQDTIELMQAAAMGVTCKEMLGVFSQHLTLVTEARCVHLQNRCSSFEWMPTLTQAAYKDVICAIKTAMRDLLQRQIGPPATMLQIEEGGVHACLGSWDGIAYSPTLEVSVAHILRGFTQDPHGEAWARHQAPLLLRDMKAAIYTLFLWNDRFIALWDVEYSLEILAGMMDGFVERLVYDIRIVDS